MSEICLRVKRFGLTRFSDLPGRQYLHMVPKLVKGVWLFLIVALNYNRGLENGSWQQTM